MIVLAKNNQVISRKVILADTFFQRFIGLMGKLRMDPHEALIITPCFQVHTMFVFFPLDLLFLDENNVILEKVNSIRPFSLSLRVKNALSVVEMKGGTLANHDIQVGDRVIIHPPV